MTAAISRQRSHTMTSTLNAADDPLTAAMAPPANETPDQRALRLRDEAEAKRISDAIDEELREARAKEKKRKTNEVRVLLLGESRCLGYLPLAHSHPGQSESGKSTTLKQFQIMYSPNAFRAERVSWRAVIYLNLARSIRRILDALDPSNFAEDEPSTPASPDDRPSTALSERTEEKLAHFSELKLRLQPLMLLEDQLNRTLAGDLSGNDLEPTRLGTYAAPHVSPNPSTTQREREVAVRSGSTWKKALNTFKGRGKDEDGALSFRLVSALAHSIL
jgi:hypothetical protein